MSDTDGSTGPAPGGSKDAAPNTSPNPEGADPDSPSLLGRLVRALSPSEDPAPAQTVPAPGAIGIANLSRKRLEDVAVPKAEIEAVPVETGLPELVEIFRQSALTRLPVFEGTLDTPIGLIHFKDLALRHGFGENGAEAFDLRGELRPLIYAPPSMPIGVLLTRMQAERKHMALMIDEYGGVDGLVTLEDLIEQVIGEIEDEHDIDEADLWIEEGTGTYLVQARAPLSSFEAAAKVSLAVPGVDEEIDTLGGLIFLLTGRIPARGEVLPHPSGAEIEVVDADPRRIKRLRVRLPGAPPPARRPRPARGEAAEAPQAAIRPNGAVAAETRSGGAAPADAPPGGVAQTDACPNGAAPAGKTG